MAQEDLGSVKVVLLDIGKDFLSKEENPLNIPDDTLRSPVARHRKKHASSPLRLIYPLPFLGGDLFGKGDPPAVPRSVSIRSVSISHPSLSHDLPNAGSLQPPLPIASPSRGPLSLSCFHYRRGSTGLRRVDALARINWLIIFLSLQRARSVQSHLSKTSL